MPESDVLIPVAKVIGPHGVKGALKVFSYSGNLESLRAVRTVLLRSSVGELKEYQIKSITPQPTKLILFLKGIEEIDQVLPHVGNEICLKRSQLPEPEEDEYYWCDLIGLEVVTVENVPIGNIIDIFETGSNDVYVVRGEKGEFLIPAIGDVINSIDLQEGKMIVTPLAGLLDL